MHDLLAEKLKQGKGALERGPFSADKDGERRVLRAKLAAGHRRVQHVRASRGHAHGELAGRRQRQVGDRGVELVHADFHRPGHHEAAHLGHHAHRGEQAQRRALDLLPHQPYYQQRQDDRPQAVPEVGKGEPVGVHGEHFGPARFPHRGSSLSGKRECKT